MVVGKKKPVFDYLVYNVTPTASVDFKNEELLVFYKLLVQLS